MARVKTCPRAVQPAYRYIRRQQSVACPMKCNRLVGPVRFEVSYLAHCVDARVCPACAEHTGRSSQNVTQGLLHRPLNCGKILLELPSVIIGPIIFEDCGESLHSE